MALSEGASRDEMSTIVAPGVGHAGAKGGLAGIRAQMAVEDASGERFGRVTDVGAAAVATVPDLPADLAERLRRAGCVKIEDTRYFRRDFRYYATADQVASVDASVVRLNVHCRDLITAFD
jgi:hypothetical protein